MADPRLEVARLFQATGQAHHDAFAVTDGDDPDWPEWYAGYLLLLPLSELLGVSLGREAIAADLLRSEAATAEWSRYYADWFLAQHSSHAAG